MNLRTVDAHVFRTDQPNAEAWPIFAKSGIQAVMCFRKNGEDGGYSLKEERDAVLAAGIGEFVSIPVGEMPYNGPTLEQVQQGIALLKGGRVWLIHCRRGCDRTGVFAACYRVAAMGWSTEAAIEEANTCGMSRLQFHMRDFLKHFKASSIEEA